MIIQLQRSFTPNELRERDCALCNRTFDSESVLVFAMDDHRYEHGLVCSSCLEYLSMRNPERFPTLEEYEEAKRLYPTPIWLSDEEADLAEEELKRSWIPRSELRVK